MISRRSPPPAEFLTDSQSLTPAEHTMRTAISLALEEVPADIREAYAQKKKQATWLEMERARQLIAVHLVRRASRHVDVVKKRTQPGHPMSAPAPDRDQD